MFLYVEVYDTLEHKKFLKKVDAFYDPSDGGYRNFSLYWIDKKQFRINTKGDSSANVYFTTMAVKDGSLLESHYVNHGPNIIQKFGTYLLSSGSSEGLGSVFITHLYSGKNLFSTSGVMGTDICHPNYDMRMIDNGKIGLYSKYEYFTEQWNNVELGKREAFMCFSEFFESDARANYFNNVEHHTLLGIFNTNTKTFELLSEPETLNN